jgi:transcription-repair coupling factor (superfamily II helicase)
VGRGARRAYAYFLHAKTSSLSEASRQRLETISEATELGAGFRIAMRDLEIRGAGELLGARQHGHVAAVGFDLYSRLLAKAVQEAKAHRQTATPPMPGAAREGARTHQQFRGAIRDEAAAYLQPLESPIQINLPLAAHLPEDYVPDTMLRLQIYRRLAALTNEKQVDDLQAELQDRFGVLPIQAQDLFFQLRLKIQALAAGAKAITTEEGQVVVRADSLEEVDRAWLQRRLGDRARVARRAVWIPLNDDDRWRTVLVAALQAVAEGLDH